MKKVTTIAVPLLALCLLLTLPGCRAIIAPYPGGDCCKIYAVRLDGRLYSFFDKADTLDQVQLLGRVTSCVAEDRLPKADEQTNNPACVNMPYGTANGQMYIYYGRVWHLCTPMEDRVSHTDHTAALRPYEPVTFSINVGGQIYYCRDEVVDVQGVEIQGRITSYLPMDAPPTVGQQSTVPECVGGEYGTYNGRMYLYYACLWHRCYLPAELNLPA